MADSMLLEPPALRGFDSFPVRTATPAMLDLDKVRAHITAITKRENYHYRGPTDPWTYLLERRCLVQVGDETLATLAGLLCFGRKPQELFPRAVVDIGHYRGVETVSYEVVHLEKDIGGTIFDQLARVEAYLWTNTHHGMTLTSGSLQRVPVHEYPQAVIRELIVNMLAHRDYTNGLSAARVQLFHNRIEWVSPGGLPPGVTVDNLLTSQASRNPMLLSILYEAGFVEAFGQGLDTVVAELKREGMQPPRFEDTGASFIATVFGRSLELLSREGIYGQLNERQRRIIQTVRTRGVVTPRDIITLVGDGTTQRTVQRDLRDLITARLLIAEGKGRAVRYRLPDDAI
jgi:predicted HTH transcriptional regulator